MFPRSCGALKWAADIVSEGWFVLFEAAGFEFVNEYGASDGSNLHIAVSLA